MEGHPTLVFLCTLSRVLQGGRTRVLHRNLLLPLQGIIRQEDGMRGEGISDSEEEVEEGDGMQKVARAPCGRPRGTTKPKASPSQQREASSKDVSADLFGQKPHSLLASLSSPEHISGDEDSSEDEVHTDSFTSYTTASSSTTADPLTSNADALEDNSSVQPLNVSPTESQFTPKLPYLESKQSDQTTNSVFIQQPSSLDSDNNQNSITTSPVPPVHRRSARSTKGASTV